MRRSAGQPGDRRMAVQSVWLKAGGVRRWLQAVRARPTKMICRWRNGRFMAFRVHVLVYRLFRQLAPPANVSGRLGVFCRGDCEGGHLLVVGNWLEK